MRVAFDIDGTIANNQHREHLAIAKKWDEFHALAALDKPLPQTLRVLQALASAVNEENIIEIWTARPDNFRGQTMLWLTEYRVPFNRLVMRQRGDWRRAHIVKLEWYLSRPMWERPELVFEDHPETTRLLREAGCCVHQVAAGRPPDQTSPH